MPIALLPNCTKPRTLDNYTNIFNAVTGNTTRNSTHCEVVWIEPETTQLPKCVLNWRNGVVQKKHNNPESSPKRGTNWDLSFYFFSSLSLRCRSFRLIFYTFNMCSLFIHTVSFNYILVMLHFRLLFYEFIQPHESDRLAFANRLFCSLHFILLFHSSKMLGNFSLDSPFMYADRSKVECKAISYHWWFSSCSKWFSLSSSIRNFTFSVAFLHFWLDIESLAQLYWKYCDRNGIKHGIYHRQWLRKTTAELRLHQTMAGKTYTEQW